MDEPRPTAIGPTDGSAAELQDGAVCIVAGCVEPPVTHRSMEVAIPIYTGEPGNHAILTNVQRQTIQAALCATHAEMLKASVSTAPLQVGENGPENIEVVRLPGDVAINEQSGSIE